MPDNSASELSYQPATKAYAFSTNPKPVEKPKKKPKPLNPLLLLIIEIAGLVLVFIIFLLILNFFNIISLSKIYPKQLGFLPHLGQTANINPGTKTATQATTFTNQNPQSANAKASPPQPTIGYNTLEAAPMGTCPLLDGCQNAAQISSVSTDSAQANFAGLGFTLNSSQLAILAMREGKISVTNTVENGENLTVVTITDPANVQQYVYKFNKTAYIPSISSGNVTEGQKIAELKNVPTITYSSKPYSFILYMQVLITKEYVKLVPSADGKYLESPNK